MQVIKSLAPIFSILAAVLLWHPFVAFAATEEVEVRFSEQELPSETVVPIVDSPDAVVNKALRFAGRFEARLTGGWFLDDPFYENQYFGGSVLYHTSETHAFGVRYQKWSGGLSDYSRQLDSAEGNYIKMDRAPGPDSAIGLAYENQAYYGKVSFAQSTVIPITFNLLAEIGALKYGAKNYPEIAGGASQRLYFNRHFGVNLDLRLLFHQSLNPVSTTNIQNGNPKPKEEDFSTKSEISTQLDVGILYLF